VKQAALAAAVLLAACRPATGPDGQHPEVTFELDAWWPSTSGDAGVGAGKVLVVNGRDDSVSLFELGSIGGPLVEAARPNIGFSPVELEAPHHAAIEPSGAHYYVGLSQYAPGSASGPHGAHGAGTVDGSVLKIRSSDNVRVGSARVDRNPGDLVLSPDGATIAVSHFDLIRVNEWAANPALSPDARVVLVDTETMEVRQRISVCPAPHGLGWSPDGATLYVACYSDELAVVTVATSAVRRVKVASNAGDASSPVYQPYGLAVSPDGSSVVVACLGNGAVRVYDVAAGQFVDARSNRTGGAAVMPSFGEAGTRVWVPDQVDGRVTEFDAATGARRRLVALPSTCLKPHHAVEAPGGTKLLVVCEGDGRGPGRLVVLDVASGSVLADAATGNFPDFVGVVKGP
jgi:DNA-binding beta-propeller fold protein YncE